ncbi:MAG: hypothetical protein RSD47_11720 [Romboutsia sp.]
MNENYKKIFWGLLLLIINVNLTFNEFNFSIIPSFISFIIIYSGLKGLSEEVAGDSKYFYRGAILSKVMIAVTLVRWLLDAFTSIDSSYIIGNSNIEVIVISFIIEAARLVIVYCVLKGIYLEYEKIYLIGFMKKVENVWNFYFIVSLITYAIQPFTINGSALVIMSIMAIIYSISYFIVAFEVKEAGKQFEKINL